MRVGIFRTAVVAVARGDDRDAEFLAPVDELLIGLGLARHMREIH